MTIGIERVILSISKGDLVISTFFPFSEYSIVAAKFLRVIDQTTGVEISAYINTLGKTWEGKTMALFWFLFLRNSFLRTFFFKFSN